jgi:hypothetical protein
MSPKPQTDDWMDDFEHKVIQVLTQRPDGHLANALQTIAGKAVADHTKTYHRSGHPMSGSSKSPYEPGLRSPKS